MFFALNLKNNNVYYVSNSAFTNSANVLEHNGSKNSKMNKNMKNTYL